MENKSNDATQARPLGERPLNAALVEMDLNKFIEQVKTENAWQDRGYNSITIYKSDAMRMVLMGMKAGSILKTHTANANITVQVLQGNIFFSALDQVLDMSKGKIIALQANIPHSVEAKEESFFLLSLAGL